MDNNNSKIINIYNESLRIFDSNLIVRSIHRDKDINFNSDHREILYAIQDCFTESNNYKINSCYRECLYGKALQISREIIPKIPPFKNIIKYYIKHFKNRINLIDSSYIIKGIKYDDLEEYKSYVYSNVFYKNKYYIIIKSNLLPNEILKNILSYLKYFNFKLFLKLREKYEFKRMHTSISSILNDPSS
tara:strand:+ start:883 stop:1449 length:567 start_codon:yes stop_codon:yes gene_type:complete